MKKNRNDISVLVALLTLISASCHAPAAHAPKKDVGAQIAGSQSDPSDANDDGELRIFPAHDFRFDNTLILFLWRMQRQCPGESVASKPHVCPADLGSVIHIADQMHADQDRTTVLQNDQSSVAQSFSANHVPFQPIDLMTRYDNLNTYQSKINADRGQAAPLQAAIDADHSAIAADQKALADEQAKPTTQQDAAKIAALQKEIGDKTADAKAQQTALAPINADIARQQKGIDKTNQLIQGMLAELPPFSLMNLWNEVKTSADPAKVASDQALIQDRLQALPIDVLTSFQTSMAPLQAGASADQTAMTADRQTIAAEEAKPQGQQDAAKIAAAQKDLEAKTADLGKQTTAMDALYAQTAPLLDTATDSAPAWAKWKADEDERRVVFPRSRDETNQILGRVDHYAHLDQIAIDVKFGPKGAAGPLSVTIQNWDPDTYEANSEVVDAEGNPAPFNPRTFSTEDGSITDASYIELGGALNFTAHVVRDGIEHATYVFKLGENRYGAADGLNHFQGDILKYDLDHPGDAPRLGVAIFDDEVH